MKIDYLGLFKMLFNLLINLWPLWLILAIILLVKILFEIIIPNKIYNWKIKKRISDNKIWRSDRELLQQIRGMAPNEFEEYVAYIFNKLGYKIDIVGKSHDGGIDIIIKKNGITSYIQCKKFITSQVSVGAVRDFYGALADKLANGKGYFITTNKFTLEAEKFSEDKPIELVDGFKLIEYIKMTQSNVNNYTVGLVCPNCGNRLIEKQGKFGKFLGCSTFPKCRYTSSNN